MRTSVMYKNEAASELHPLTSGSQSWTRFNDQLTSFSPRRRDGSCREELLDVGETRARGARVDVGRGGRRRGSELTEQIDELGIGRRPVRKGTVQNEAL